MIDNLFREKIKDALGIQKLDIGPVKISGNFETSEYLIVMSYAAIQVRYRFGLVSFAIVKTSKDWRICLLLPKVMQQDEEIILVRIVQDFDFSLGDTLKSINIYPKDDLTGDNSDYYLCLATIATRNITTHIALQSLTNDKQFNKLWESVKKTIKNLLVIYETDDAKAFLEKYSLYLNTGE